MYELLEAVNGAFAARAAVEAEAGTRFSQAQNAADAQLAQERSRIASQRAVMTGLEQRADGVMQARVQLRNARHRAAGQILPDVPLDDQMQDCIETARNALKVLPSFFSRREAAIAIAGACADAELVADTWLDTVDSRHLELTDDARRTMETANRNAEARLHQTLSDLAPLLVDYEADVARRSPPWDSPQWAEWAPARNLPDIVRIGGLVTRQRDRIITVPAVTALPGGRPLVIAVEDGFQEVVEALRALLVRLLATFPPGKLKFLFIDPVGLGQSVAPLLHLADHNEELIGRKVWTEPRHIEERLSDETAHLEMVIQKYLRSQYANIEAHNRDAGEVAEAYHAVVVVDFPQNFSDTAAARLVSLMENGPRCGVYPIVLIDLKRQLPHGFDVTTLYRSALAIGRNENGFRLAVPSAEGWHLELEKPFDLSVAGPGQPQTLFGRIVDSVGRKAKVASGVEVSEDRVFGLVEQARQVNASADIPVLRGSVRLGDPKTWWQGDSTSRLSAPLGRSGATEVTCLSLGSNTAQHALVAGKTGSGKSTLLHAVIVNLAVLYSPDEVQLYLVDFKEGVEFKPYADHALPHARVVAIESEREFGLSVLRHLNKEMGRRGELFRSNRVENIALYRQRVGETMPRVLLVIDEFHKLFSDDDDITRDAATLLDRLVREGRAFGIHVLLGSQSLAGMNWAGQGRSTLAQIAVRIALQCSDADSRLILAEDNPAARALTRPGEAIYNASNGLQEGNRRFQVVWLPDEQRDAVLRTVAALAKREGNRCRPTVFEGDAPADLRRNAELGEASRQGAAAGAALRLWLGEPVTIDHHVSLKLRRQGGSNVLMIGSDQRSALGMLVAAMIAVAVQDPATAMSVVDFGPIDSGFGTKFVKLAEALPNIRLFRARQFPAVLARLSERVQRRLHGEDPMGGREVLFLVSAGQARDLDASSYDGVAAELSQHLGKVLRDGPEVGIHVVAWCDSFTSFDRRLGDDRRREFAFRVATQMSSNDSSRLVESVAASNLRTHQGVLFSEDENRLVKFRAYSVVSDADIERLGARLRA